MKKLFAIMLCICMLTGTAAYADVTSVVAEKEYELWTQSPSITCGLTSDDVRIYKALDQNLLELYPLTLIGDNYYFAICSYKMTDGGYNGKSKTTQFYLYTLYATDTGFIILSKVTAGNEYYWDRGYCFADISGKVNAAFYNNNNSEVPYYIVNPKGKYTNSNLDEYDEYFFITSSGKLYRMSENTEYGTEGYPYIKDKILYRGQNKYRRSSTTYYYYMSDGSTKASNSTPMFFKNGVITYGTETRVPVADMTASNGYTMYTEGFDSNTSFPLYMPIPGSDNLFFNTTDTYTYNSSVGKYYNYLKIDVFKSNNGIMSNVSSKTITTVSTSSVTYTYQKINDLDENYYTSKGLLVPSVAIGTTAVITKDGTVCPLDLDTTIYKNYVYPCTYNGHFSVIRSYNGSSTIYKKDTTNNNYYYWQAINEISFDVNGNKTITDDLELRIQSSPHTGQNGYFSSYSTWNNSSFTAISSKNKIELEWRVNEMKKLLISQDITIKTCSFYQEQAFRMCLPILNIEKRLYDKSKRNVLTTGVASCYPFTSFEISDDNGILLGVNKHNNSLVIVDIFNSKKYKNANMAILGTSGAGKTFTMQLMALRMRRKNIQVFILAPLKGHEFHRACKNIGGEFIQISPASSNCINIMEIRKIDNTANELLDGPILDKSFLAGKIQRLHIFFSLLIPDMSYEEKQLLDEAMVITYANKGITHQNETLDNGRGGYVEMPVLGDLYEVLMGKPETRRLANILNRLVNGSAKTFNQQTNVNLDNKYTVLDISELSGDLLTVGMFVALDYVWDKAKEDRTKEKAIFLDELWQLIGASSNKLAAEFVLEIFKIIRGYGGSAICATQDLNDFFALDGGKYGKGIINNAKTKIILNLEEDEAARVQDILKLSETELMNITHFERGSGLISTNSNNVTVEFRASDFEKELITTDRAELQAIIERCKETKLL